MKKFLQQKNFNDIFKVIFLIVITFSFVFIFMSIHDLKIENNNLRQIINDNDEKSNAVISSLSNMLDEALKDNITIYLPDVIYVASGRTIEIYDDHITSLGSALSKHYNVTWDCAVGQNLDSKFSITAADSLIGEYPLTFLVYDDYLNPVASKKVTLSIVDDVINDFYSIVNIGDSLSLTDVWYEEVMALSDNHISYVGTRDYGNYSTEARAGFSAGSYLTETEYSFENEGVHPFYNPDTKSFDWDYYKNTTGITPDIVQIFLGRNCLELDPSENVNDIASIVKAIRKSDPDIPVFIVNTVYSGDQNGLGYQQNSKGFSRFPAAFVREEELQIFNLMTALPQALAKTDNIYFIPLALTHDSLNNFDSQLVSVNSRSEDTTSIHVEAIHPNNYGYLQFADCMFSVYCGILN